MTAQPAARRSDPVGVDRRPVLVPLRLAQRSDHPIDARDARRDPPSGSPTTTSTRAWAAPDDRDAPAISFQLLPIDDMGSGEDLYIKMNSRGKPLTQFENFKAHFEQDIAHAGDGDEFAHKIDGSWSDLLWRHPRRRRHRRRRVHALLRLRHRVCEWRAGQLPGGVRLETRALRLFGTAGQQAEESLEFLFHAFNTWAGADIGDEFGQLFATNPADWPATPTGSSCSERKPAPTCSTRAAGTTALSGSPTAAHFSCSRCSWTAPAPPRNSRGG